VAPAVGAVMVRMGVRVEAWLRIAEEIEGTSETGQTVSVRTTVLVT
jgi:hypothetical protein